MNRDDEALLLKMGRRRKGCATIRPDVMNQTSPVAREVAAAKRLCAARLAFMKDRVTIRLTPEGCELVRKVRDQRLDSS